MGDRPPGLLRRRTAVGSVVLLVVLVGGVLGLAAYWLSPLLPDREPVEPPDSETSVAEAPVDIVEAGYAVERIFEVEAKALASKTMELAGEDGARLVLPPGTLNQDATIQLTKYVPTGDLGEPVVIYDVDLGGASLTAEAELHMPIEHTDRVTTADDVHVSQVVADGKRIERVPIELTADRSEAILRTNHFSPVVKTEPALWVTYAQEAMAKERTGGPLPVPFYAQDAYSWCWAASEAMVEGAHGGEIRMWELAEEFGASKGDGLLFVSDLETSAAKRSFKAERKWFWAAGSLQGYLMYQIDKARPVFLGLPYADHAVVVVGYTPHSVIIHDPSGALIRDCVGASEAAKQNLAKYQIPWGPFNAAVTKRTLGLSVYTGELKGGWRKWVPSPFGDIAPNSTLVLLAPPKPKTLSIQLFAWDRTFPVQHVRPDGSRAGTVRFRWDGKVDGGWVFTHALRGADGTKLRASKPHALCNSDKITEIDTAVSNTGSGAADATVEAWLDGAKIGSHTRKLPPQSDHKVTVPTRRLDLTANPLPLGPHRLELRVVQGKRTIDRAVFDLEVIPGIVPGLSATYLDDRHVRVKWDPAVEEARLGAAMQYQVHKGPGPSRTSHTHAATAPPKATEIIIELTKAEAARTMYFSVWARDTKTGVTAVDALPLKGQKEKNYFPLLVGTKLWYEWTFGGVPKGAMEGVSVTTTELLTVEKDGELKSIVHQKASAKEGAVEGSATFFRQFDRRGDRIHFGNATVTEDFWATDHKKKMTMKATVEERQSGPNELVVTEGALKTTKKWSSRYLRTIEVTQMTGTMPEAKAQEMLNAFSSSSSPLRKGSKLEKKTTTKYRVLGYETVKVRGGTFKDCLKLEIEMTGEPKTTQWLAPGVGPVKTVQSLGHGISLVKALKRPPILPE